MSDEENYAVDHRTGSKRVTEDAASDGKLSKPVLGDITDKVLAQAHASSPKRTSRLKRRPKAPTRSTVRPDMLSSLPPSSPPSQSSRLPIPGLNVENVPLDTAATTKEEDPFGFFSVEKRLKSKRAGNRAPGMRFRKDEIPRDPPSSHSEQAYLQSVLPKKKQESRDPLRTPRKQRIRTRDISVSEMSEASLYTPNSSSAPSSPSPTKRLSTLLEHDRSRSPKSNNEAAAALRGSRRTRKKAREGNGEDLNPREIAQKLLALLPRRRIKVTKKDSERSTKARGKAKNRSVREGRDIQRKYKVKEGTQPQKPSAKGKGKARNESPENHEDSEEELLLRERQKRLEYFKKLDEYSIEKENVYII